MILENKFFWKNECIIRPGIWKYTNVHEILRNFFYSFALSKSKIFLDEKPEHIIWIHYFNHYSIFL